jgi:hypothetical protein
MPGSCLAFLGGIALELFDLVADGFVFGKLVLEEADGEQGFCFDAAGGEQVPATSASASALRLAMAIFMCLRFLLWA